MIILAPAGIRPFSTRREANTRAAPGPQGTGSARSLTRVARPFPIPHESHHAGRLDNSNCHSPKGQQAAGGSFKLDIGIPFDDSDRFRSMCASEWGHIFDL